MVLAFPPNPNVGQVYQLWTWDGQKWVCNCVGSISPGVINGVIGMPNKTVVFHTSGIYTPSAGIASVIVECVGGGGSGGGVGNSGQVAVVGGGGGGAGGGYSRSVLLPSQIGASQPVTIGTGGVAGSVSLGTGGGPTSFGNLVVANGGGPGQPYAGIGSPTLGQPGLGAFAGTGDLALPGQNGFWGIVSGSTTTPGSTEVAIGGNGGNGPLGGGGSYGPSLGTGGTAAGGNGTAGGGGSGGAIYGSGSNAVGGNGGNGWCVVTEYTPA